MFFLRTLWLVFLAIILKNSYCKHENGSKEIELETNSAYVRERRFIPVDLSKNGMLQTYRKLGRGTPSHDTTSTTKVPHSLAISTSTEEPRPSKTSASEYEETTSKNPSRYHLGEYTIIPTPQSNVRADVYLKSAKSTKSRSESGTIKDTPPSARSNPPPKEIKRGDDEEEEKRGGNKFKNDSSNVNYRQYTNDAMFIIVLLAVGVIQTMA